MICMIHDMYDLYNLYDLYDLAHVAGWEPYNQHDLGHVHWVESVPYRSCTSISQNGGFGIYQVDCLDRDLSDVVPVIIRCKDLAKSCGPSPPISAWADNYFVRISRDNIAFSPPSSSLCCTNADENVFGPSKT